MSEKITKYQAILKHKDNSVVEYVTASTAKTAFKKAVKAAEDIYSTTPDQVTVEVWPVMPDNVPEEAMQDPETAG